MCLAGTRNHQKTSGKQGAPGKDIGHKLTSFHEVQAWLSPGISANVREWKWIDKTWQGQGVLLMVFQSGSGPELKPPYHHHPEAQQQVSDC